MRRQGYRFFGVSRGGLRVLSQAFKVEVTLKVSFT